MAYVCLAIAIVWIVYQVAMASTDKEYRRELRRKHRRGRW